MQLLLNRLTARSPGVCIGLRIEGREGFIIAWKKQLRSTARSNTATFPVSEQSRKPKESVTVISNVLDLDQSTQTVGLRVSTCIFTDEE